jgi:glycosyltransferase involved in cell wall biosynthesis
MVMRFINRLKNSVHIHEINKVIPYLEDEEQFISADDVLKSPSFQNLIVSKKFEITEIGDDRIESNLLLMQNGEVDFEEEEPLEVLISGHFYSNTGYAKANRNFALALARAGVKTAIKPVNHNEDGLNELEIQQIAMLDTEASDKAILIDSSIPSFGRKKCNHRYSILYTTVESATVPQQFVDACSQYNEVWVTSNFCKDVLTAAGVANVSVVPNSVNHRLYNCQTPPHVFNPPLKGYTFLSVFGWNYRKGYDVLLKAYLEEFSKEDDVSLLIVSRYQYDGERRRRFKIEEEIKEYIATFGGWHRAPHVARCGLPIPEFEMPRLYRACDCFVLPTRGEGFGLPYMEAALCGLPVIATRHSGQTMFLNDSNSYLLDVDKMSRAERGATDIHYWDGQVFPELKSPETIKSLGKIMRHVYDNGQEASRKTASLKNDILSKYTCENVASLAKMKLERIWKDL